MHRSAPLQPARLLPATLPACLTRARRQLVREAGDPAGGFLGIPILGRRWRTQRSLLTWSPTTRLGAFVLLLPRGVEPPGRPSSDVQPARTFSFPRFLSLSPLFLGHSLSSRHLTPGEKLLFQVCKSPMQVSAGVSGNKGCVEPSILRALAG